MSTPMLSRLPYIAAFALVAIAVAACAFQLRGDEEQTNTPVSAGKTSDPLATKLAECRSVTYEQKDALSECRKTWAEKRRQFLRQKAQGPADNVAPQSGTSLFVAPKDESRLPSIYPSIQQNGKD